MSDVTRILESIEHGDPKAADELSTLHFLSRYTFLTHRFLRKDAASVLDGQRAPESAEGREFVRHVPDGHHVHLAIQPVGFLAGIDHEQVLKL